MLIFIFTLCTFTPFDLTKEPTLKYFFARCATQKGQAKGCKYFPDVLEKGSDNSKLALLGGSRGGGLGVGTFPFFWNMNLKKNFNAYLKVIFPIYNLNAIIIF